MPLCFPAVEDNAFDHDKIRCTSELFFFKICYNTIQYNRALILPFLQEVQKCTCALAVQMHCRAI